MLERYRVSKSTLYRWTRQRPRQSFRTRTSWGEQQGERSQRTRYKYAVVVRNLWLLMRERHRPRTVAEAAGLLSRPGVDVRTLYRAINHWGLGCGRWAEAPSDHQARVLMDVIREGAGRGCAFAQVGAGTREAGEAGGCVRALFWPCYCRRAMVTIGKGGGAALD